MQNLYTDISEAQSCRILIGLIGLKENISNFLIMAPVLLMLLAQTKTAFAHEAQGTTN